MPDSVRVDVWLWSVRQCKTRTLATTACKAGHVRVNGETAKPAASVKVGDEVRYRVQGFDRILKVTALIVKRTSAPLAPSVRASICPSWPGSGERAARRRRNAANSTD